MQIDRNKFINASKFLIPLIIFTLIWAFVFISSDIFQAGFNYFVDDHWIVFCNQNCTSLDDIFIKPFTSLSSEEPKVRFRPLYDILIRLFSQVYGLNSFVWYLSSLVAATITTGIFYTIGRLQKFSYIESSGFAGLIVFGQQASTYARFGTPETTATLFIAVALLLGSLNIKNSRISIISNFWFVIFALLASLNKEACILMLPALCFFRLWIYSIQNNTTLKESYRQNRNTTLFILAIFVGLLTYIKLNNVMGPGYAGIDRDTLSIEQLMSSITRNGAIFASAIVVNIIYLLKYRYRNQHNFYILIALIIIPQLIVYNKTGMGWHYVLPAAIGVSLLTFYPIYLIRSQSDLVSKALVAIITWVILLQIVFTATYFKEVADLTKSVQSVIKGISTCVDQDARFAIVANPYLDYEKIDAFKKISAQVIKNNQIYLATYGSQKSSLNIDVMKQLEQPWYFLNPQKLENTYQYMTVESLNLLERSKIRGIVVTNANRVEQSLIALKLDWFIPEQLSKKYYPELDMSVYCKK